MVLAEQKTISLFKKYCLILVATAVYLFFSLVYLRLPGLEYDEVLFANAALGDLDGTFIEWKTKVFGKTVPLMLMQYLGALKAYLYAPVFAFFGTSVASVRLPVIVAGLITLFFTYKLVKAMLGEKVALVALLLFASDPAFIFANKLDWGPVSLMMAFKMTSLYFLWRWLTHGKALCLVVACFLLGLGLFDKMIFIWFIGATMIALTLCFGRELRKRLGWRQAVLALCCFFIGCSPLIAFNLAFPLRSFERQQVVTTSWPEALAYRYNLFVSTLEGSAVYGVVNNQDPLTLGDPVPPGTADHLDTFITRVARLAQLKGTLMPVALIVAVAFVLGSWILNRFESGKNGLFFLTLLVLITIFICITAQATGPHHVIAVHPFPHILIGFAICELARKRGSGTLTENVRGFVGLACILVLIFAHLVISARYLKSFNAKGGGGAWSDAIYELAEYTKVHIDRSFMLMDWGFSNQLLLLSEGRIKKQEAFVPISDGHDDEGKTNAIYPYLNGANNLFVFHFRGYETFPLLDVFKRALSRYGFEGRVLRTFYQRDGQPVYLIYEVFRPELELHTRSGHFFYLREGEEWDAKSGGEIDVKRGASQTKALGNFWGRDASDFVVYSFALPRQVSETYLYLRYAFEKPSPQRYDLFLDNNWFDTLTLESTSGFGYSRDEWKTHRVKMGVIGPGMHQLKLRPAAEDQVMNLDYFYISQGDFWLEPSQTMRK